MNTIMKNIKLDVPLEESLFSLTPPAGYKPFGVEVKSETVHRPKRNSSNGSDGGPTPVSMKHFLL